MSALFLQEDFDSFEDVDDIYQSLPLDKIEALENLEAIPNVAPSIVVKEKVSTSESCSQQHSEVVKVCNVFGCVRFCFSFSPLSSISSRGRQTLPILSLISPKYSKQE